MIKWLLEYLIGQFYKDRVKEKKVPSFSIRSKSKLATCHPDLQRLMNEVIKHYDCTILEGHRDQATQDEYYRTGKSKLKWPNGKHNTKPSQAVDVVPYPIDWDDWKRFYAFSHFVLGVATQMGIRLRLGADWDGDHSFKDQTFHDMPHIELKLY